MLWRGFQKPKRLAVDAETLTETFGKFSAQPFERGFGTTIGNALRRTLLSSIEGAAVTAVRIEGVLHEFQSIAGVVEDADGLVREQLAVAVKGAQELAFFRVDAEDRIGGIEVLAFEPGDRLELGVALGMAAQGRHPQGFPLVIVVPIEQLIEQ